MGLARRSELAPPELNNASCSGPRKCRRAQVYCCMMTSTDGKTAHASPTSWHRKPYKKRGEGVPG